MGKIACWYMEPGKKAARASAGAPRSCRSTATTRSARAPRRGVRSARRWPLAASRDTAETNQYFRTTLSAGRRPWRAALEDVTGSGDPHIMAGIPPPPGRRAKRGRPVHDSDHSARQAGYRQDDEWYAPAPK
jgi:hypothetical protein